MIDPQRAAAMAIANEIRSKRAILKKEIASNPARLEEVLEMRPCPTWLRSERLDRMLRCVPRMGSKRVARIFEEGQILGIRTMGNVTFAERQAVLRVLREKTHREAA